MSQDVILRMLYPMNPPHWHLFYDLLIIPFICAFLDFKKIKRLRNLDILMLCAWVPLGDYEYGNLRWTMVLGYLPLLYFLPRLLYQVWRKTSDPCVINFSPRWLIVLALTYFGLGCVMNLVYPVPFHDESLSDTAQSGMAGARYLLRGRVPYGNLDHGWDTYPPAYYYAYVPFERLVSDGKPITNHAEYYGTYGWSARLLTCTLNGSCMLALVLLGTRLRNRHFGLALAFAWAAIPYTLASTAYSQTGHILPGAFTVFALLGLSYSAVAGALILGFLAAAAVYPVCFAPIWAAHLGLRRGLGFLLCVVVMGLALTGPMLLQENGLEKFIDSVTQHSTKPTQFSPWYQHPWMMPLKWLFMSLFPLFVALATWAARGRGFVPLIALTGAVVVWGQLFYRSAPGRYHLWMFPCLIAVLLLGQTRAAFEEKRVPG